MNLNELTVPLSVDEIDFRVQSVGKGYAIILAYKDARCDMNRLDKVCGVGYWQRKHQTIDNKFFCNVGIWMEELKQWIWKEDVGTESNTEKEKGQVSDSFKRACFNWGIGRELYDYPFIYVNLNQEEYEIDPKRQNKYKATNKLRLKQWKWKSLFNDNELVELCAWDQNNKLRFEFKKYNKPQKENEQIKQELISEYKKLIEGKELNPDQKTFDDTIDKQPIPRIRNAINKLRSKELKND